VQFSHQGNGAVDGSIAVGAPNTPFVYDPRGSEPSLASFAGALPLAYRTVEHDANGGKIYGAWVSFPYTLALAASNATIGNLKLIDITGATTPTAVTSDPRVSGAVLGAQAGTQPNIQFQYNGDGQVDETATANFDGTFSDSLPGLPYGQTTIQARAVEWDATDGYYLFGAWTTLTFDYEPPAPPNVIELLLANPTAGSTTSASDPTVKGQVDIGAPTSSTGTSSATTGSATNPIVDLEFDLNGDGVADATGTTDAQGDFTFTPTAGSLAYGSVTIAARTVIHDADQTALAYSPWKSLTFTLTPSPVAVPSVVDLRLANDDGASATDKITSDATVTGRVTFPPPVAPAVAENVSFPTGTLTSSATQSVDFLTVQVDTNGDGVPDATTTTGVGGTFSYLPTGLSAGNVTIALRSFVLDAGQNKVYGAWQSFSFTYQPAVAGVPSVSELKLANPLTSATAQSAATASDATVVGQLTAATTTTGAAAVVAGMTVEIDVNDDGVPDATVVADPLGKFTYTPSGLSAGSVTIQARARQHDYATGGFSYGAWTPLTFTYQPPVFTPPVVSSLLLADDTGSSSTDNVTANATLKGVAEIPAVAEDVSLPTAGTLTSSATPNLLVEIDTNDDGVPDATVWPDAQGNFLFSPQNLAYGAVTIQARAKAWDAATGAYVAGAWTPITFTYEQEANAAPVFAGLSLLDGDGQPTASDTTMQPVIGGQLTYQGGLAGLTVEFDTAGDGQPHGSAVTDSYGDFSFTPSGLSYGNVTIQARTRALDDVTHQYLVGAWTPFSFTYQQPSAPIPAVSTLALADDNGVSNADDITSDPALTGTVTFPAGTSGVAENVSFPTGASSAPSVDGLTVQFDTNGDGVPDGSATTDASGDFNWTPSGLADGQHTIEARAVDQDGNGNALYGAWTPLTFTLTAAATSGTTIGTVGLANNVGPSSTALISTDGTISGQLTGANVANQTVEIDTTGTGVSSATVTTDSTGNFSYTPTGLQQGTDTIAVRTVDDSNGVTASGGNQASGGSQPPGGSASGNASGGWTTLSFVLSSNPSGSPAQSEAAALAQHATDLAAAQSSHDAAQATAASNFQAAESAASASYRGTLASANSAQAAGVAAAQSSYASGLASANATYNQAVAQAGTTFATAMQSYSGNTAAYAQSDFQWPGAPAAPAGPDRSQPTSPVAPPSFSGPGFNASADPTFIAAQQAAQTAYDTAVSGAQSTYAAALTTAENANQSALAAAVQTQNTANAAADAAYNTALAVPNPTNMTTEAQNDLARRQAATQVYETALQIAQGAYAGKIGTAFNALWGEYAGAVATHNAAYNAAW